MSDMQYRQPVWWGEFDFEAGSSRQWELAGLELAITRHSQEWHFWTQRTAMQSEDNHEWQLRDANALVETQARFTRFVFRQTASHLSLLPRMADRSIVIRPITPLFVPGGQETVFFVSTPLWIAGYAEGVIAPLFDIPVIEPRETWFGPTPARGELCYATKVTGRTTLAQVAPRPFRAVTPVHVRNHGSSSLPIERINIPAPFLPVYAAESGRLWTPALTVTRDAHSPRLHIHIDKGITTEAGHVTQLTPARRGEDEHALIRVFDNFFD
ncbi:MAG: hypothetical protein REI12_13625 [Pedobacter sp.]|nr:hypothetical protein [Pedobacter sp.]